MHHLLDRYKPPSERTRHGLSCCADNPCSIRKPYRLLIVEEVLRRFVVAQEDQCVAEFARRFPDVYSSSRNFLQDKKQLNYGFDSHTD